MDASSGTVKAPRRRRWPWWILGGLLVAFLAVGFFAWRFGPAGVLQWAVRFYDPALRLKVDGAAWRGGEIVLRGVQLHLKGRSVPVFRAKEARAGLGGHWRQGRFGSLVLEDPVVSVDKMVVEHFMRRSVAADDSGAGLRWEFGRVEIRRGHVWLQEFGDPALDISVAVEATLERVGPGAPDVEHVWRLSEVYVAVRDGPDGLPLFGAGEAEARTTLAGLTGRRLAGLRVEQGWLLAGAALQAFAGVGGGADEEGEEDPAGGFVFEAIDLVDLQISTGEVGGGLPEMTFLVNTALRNVGLGAVAVDLAEKIHQVEFADIDILSPLDPLKRAVTVRALFAKFSLAGLARQEIEELVVLSPTIYVGEALFEYMAWADDDGKPPPEPVAATEGWRLRQLQVDFGKLVVAVGGHSQLGLPLSFRTTAENISLSSLAGLSLDLVLTIPPDDYEFPDYDLAFTNVRGDLRLNYPPDDDENNLVNVVYFDRARWRNFTGRNLWVSVTFDLQGINGQFGGEAYRGYVSGGFSFFLRPESPWTGWISGTGLDLGDLTEAAAPQHFVMSGRADMKLEVNGSGPQIDRVLGGVETKSSGRVVVNRLNEFLESIPPEWAPLKRGVTQVGLEALRDFDYTKAGANFWFVGREGQLTVNMKGPSGSRNLEVVLHGADGGGAWTQGVPQP